MVSPGSILAGLLALAMTAPCHLLAADAGASVAQKLTRIERGEAAPGSVVRLSEAELNAWVRAKTPTVVDDGFREPKLTLGAGEATASALVDFLKVRHANGAETNWLVAKLIQGEKLVRARATIRSAQGTATVHLLRVEVGGLAVSGAALNFLVDNFLRPFYPDAQIEAPFELEPHVDRVEVTPAELRIYIRK